MQVKKPCDKVHLELQKRRRGAAQVGGGTAGWLLKAREECERPHRQERIWTRPGSQKKKKKRENRRREANVLSKTTKPVTWTCLLLSRRTGSQSDSSRLWESESDESRSMNILLT